MKKTYPYTFNEGDFGVCGPVISIPVEGQDYQCKYLQMFNYLRDRGYTKIKGTKRWVAPEKPYTTYGTIEKAYSAQLYKEMRDR